MYRPSLGSSGEDGQVPCSVRSATSQQWGSDGASSPAWGPGSPLISFLWLSHMTASSMASSNINFFPSSSGGQKSEISVTG